MQGIEFRTRQSTSKVIWVNLISVLINILLSISAFYFAFINDSSATGAFAADCVLDFVSSAIVLWRYFGDLTSEFAHIREQIACLYLGGLFEISSLAIIIKAVKDITSGATEMDSTLLTTPSDTGGGGDGGGGNDTLDLVYEYPRQASDGSTELVILASVATIACLILTLFKCSLYSELKDNSLLLDVINTLISSVFAISIVMSQVLISFDASFWYLDPVLSIILAIFMMLFGLKVLHENIGLLKNHRDYEETHIISGSGDDDHNDRARRYNNFTASYGDHITHIIAQDDSKTTLLDKNNNNYNSGNFRRSNYGTNLSLSIDRYDFYDTNQKTKTKNDWTKNPIANGWLRAQYPNILIIR